MCLYMGVAEHLVDILTFCVCRMIEMSFFVLMMTCGLTTPLHDEPDDTNGNTIIHSG
ncbi:primacord [Haematobia irritans]|uniref:primacord n=1 Tax=Haematobia irritans TaxID=7368 RepID=UPI003F4F6441